MFKVKCIDTFDDDVWQFIIGESYNCEVNDEDNGESYIIYDLDVTDGTNKCKLTIVYGENDFHKRFENIKEVRKLKLDKINESIS